MPRSLFIAQMAPPAWVSIFGLTFPIAILLLVLGIAWVKRHGTQANLQALVDQLGFQINPDFGALSFGTSHLVAGQYGGRAMRFFNYQVLGEKNRPWLAVAAASRLPDGASLQVAPNRWFIRAAFKTRRLGTAWEGGKLVQGSNSPRLQSIITDDPAFDEPFLVRTSDPDWAKKILAPKVRAALLAAREQAEALVRLSVEGDEVRYSVCGRFNQSGLVDHLIAQMDFVCGLAAQIEAAAPRSATPSPQIEQPARRTLRVPAISLTISLATILLIEVVPLFENKIARVHGQSSAPLQLLLGASHFLRDWWWALFLAGFALTRLFKRVMAKQN